MLPIQMVDLKRQYEKIKPEIDAAIQHVIDTTSFVKGTVVNDFEKNLENYLKAKYVIACGNGTDAIQIALMALGFKQGDEIITPSHTYIAAVEAIALLGLKPVFIEVDPDTFNIDVRQIESKITNKTAAILPVHLYGQCADMEPILAIAEKHGLKVIEDTAQAIGVEYTFSNGMKNKAGTMGDIGTTSFYPSKNLGCYGDGGAIFTNDDLLAKRIRMIANHGQEKTYYHELIGVNSRLDSIQAGVLNEKLKHLDEYAEARNKVAAYYDKAFSSNEELVIPKRASNSTHVFHQYTLKLMDGCRRDALKAFLAEKHIPTMIYYPVLVHLQNAYKQFGYKAGDLPVSESLCSQVISLPIHTEMDLEQLEYIVNFVNQFFK